MEETKLGSAILPYSSVVWGSISIGLSWVLLEQEFTTRGNWVMKG